MQTNDLHNLVSCTETSTTNIVDDLVRNSTDRIEIVQKASPLCQTTSIRNAVENVQVNLGYLLNRSQTTVVSNNLNGSRAICQLFCPVAETGCIRCTAEEPEI